MKQLIMHIEWDEGSDLTPTLTHVLDLAMDFFGPEAAVGWRYFSSLEDAEAWESGSANIEEVGVCNGD